ncbi:MAG: gamma-glutamyl-gamma-aminobutyrate hydrolase family protein [Planctomycetes bacterium]|nr:gamma-glutamyl-gamma-aminobutyrate hydrolase family protein [Planctomycetota bacterium]
MPRAGKKRPRIGINCKLLSQGAEFYYKLDERYPEAVRRAGGVPILMPFFRTRAEARELLERLDGLLFTGGTDIDPARWGETPHSRMEPLIERKENSDFFAMRWALDGNMPLLGVCYGCQLLNVALGGSIHQHLPDVYGTGVPHANGAVHEIRAEPGTRTAEVLRRRTARVRSSHHQSIHGPGKDLKVTAYAPDGVIEGVESDRHRFAVGVQWHPELTQDCEEQRRLFAALVAEAKR